MPSTPGFGFGYSTLVWAYHHLGEKDKAIAALVNEFRVSMNFPEGALALERTYAEGDYTGAFLAAAQALEKRSKTIHVGPLNIGGIYELAGEYEKAIDWYEVGYQIKGPGVPYLGVSCSFSKIRSNPRFIKLLRDIKLDYWADKYSQPSE